MAGLLIMLASSFISLINYVEIGGIIRIFKYIMYVGAIFSLSKYNFHLFIKIFNNVALISISTTLLIYLYQFFTFDGSFTLFVHYTTWDRNFVPSGFSNLNLNIFDLSFSRSGGNHGIYGTYLVLVIMVNFNNFLDSKLKPGFKNYFLIVISLINISLISSREALLVLIVVFALYGIHQLINLRINKMYYYGIFIFLLFISLVFIYNIDIGIINKINYTISALSESGGEYNISARLNVWTLILMSYTLFPIYFFVGYGYNESNFNFYLTQTNEHYYSFAYYASIPESLFLTFLGYGGILSLSLLLLFFLAMLRFGWKNYNRSTFHKLFFYFTIGLIISNNFGGSMLSDMLFAQYSLVYLWLNKNQNLGNYKFINNYN
ncbi:MAG: oligosaccharide repeat unit polymerase [Bacteroidota bacterium]|nr:oligosaccharide repeat unit polymerase [Bacteroidota bacterium]